MHITHEKRTAEGDVHHAREIRATRIGGHAHGYLAERDRNGRVVSTFAHGLNIVFDEASEPTWIAVQTLAVPLHPWAVEVQAILGGVVVGAPAHVGDGVLTFGTYGPHAPSATGHSLVSPTADFGPRTAHSAPRTGDSEPRAPAALLVIHTLHATCHELRIAPYTPEEAERALSRLPLLERFLNEEKARRPSDPFQPQIDAILSRWRATADPSLLVDLVGLGSGSTPAGDDILVGMLAAFTAFGRDSARARDQLAELRGALERSAALERTPCPSAQVLSAALDGCAVEPLRDLALALGARLGSSRRFLELTACVTSLGDTSGRALLSGLIRGAESSH